ncbi:glycosyltransferase family 2 protein [Aquimarina pacifica]|uniref:glycosyltransferase family 2 protein n=1 Tax=Aquimarina pacifica TaxID=1296415 RepID=UPI0004720C54|nr:glycosyltransferase family 2 protein [Aquimarina pacifica]
MRESISVIIPTYNRSNLLPDSVASVLSQSFSVSEILIVDDCSDTKHLEALDEVIKKSPLIRVLKQQVKKGVSACRNIGLNEAKGQYVVFLDDDDTLHTNMIEDAILAFREDGATDIIGCRGEVVNSLGEPSVNSLRALIRKETLRTNYTYGLGNSPSLHFLMYHPLIHSLVIKRSIIGNIRFPEGLIMGEDCYFFLSLVQNGARFGYIEKVNVNVRIHDGNSSHLANLDVKEDFYKELLGSELCGKLESAIIEMQLFYALLKKRKPRCIFHLIRSLSQPLLFLRFFRYQFRIRTNAFFYYYRIKP